MVSVDPVLTAVLRCGLAGLLLSSAWHKLRDVHAFRAAIEAYALLPSRAIPLMAMLLVAAEVAFGLGLSLPRLQSFGAAGSALLLTLYSAAIAVNLVRGRTRIDCGCAGPAGALPLSWSLVVRNGLFIAVSIVAALPPAPRALEIADSCIVAVATLTFAVLYVAAETALANAARWRHATQQVAA